MLCNQKLVHTHPHTHRYGERMYNNMPIDM